MSITPASGVSFDASQFKLQADGTFRISIRGMAAMAGVDQSGLTRSLKSAEDENPLPCAKSLLAQGLCPEDVSTWGETGGIPEAAAENALPCARSLLAQGFDPAAVSTWGGFTRRLALV